MRVTIEIEPEEAARFVKAFVPSVPVINNVSEFKFPTEYIHEWTDFWASVTNPIGEGKK